MFPARRLAMLVLLGAFASTALSQDVPARLDLEAAWSRAPEVSTDVATRRIDLDIANRTATRARLDPLATGLERLQAEQGLAAAAASLASAERAARISALQAYVAVIQAIDGAEEALVRADLAQRNLAAARVRHEAGAITDLAMSQSGADAEAAERAARDAATELAFAWGDLAAVVGGLADELRAGGLAPVSTDLAVLPDLDRDIATLATVHAGIASAERALALAELRLRGADHDGSSPNAVADARADVATARRRVEDTVRNAEQQLRAAHQNLLVAFGRLDDARSADATAVATLEAQRVRWQAGELSPIAWQQAQLDRDRVAASSRGSLHATWLQWLRYEQALAGG
jgi:hypothetical protein